MEIDRAIRECSDGRLQNKYKNAAYVIRRAFALYSFEEVAFSFNGGKDSTALLHLLRAGYFLHKKDMDSISGKKVDCEQKCAIRTIYFESPSAFPEINSFTYETANSYNLQLDIICSDFKSGLEDLLRKRPVKAIFLGTRIGDPNAVGQEQFSPSSFGWPPFMRVNPILDWSYRDVWAFILTCKVQYCSLYDKGYTSIGSIHDTVPNASLYFTDSENKEHFKPAYLLLDGRLERAGRTKKYPSISDGVSIISNGNSMDKCWFRSFSASIIAVGDEILFGTFEDKMGAALCKKLHAIGWQVTHQSVVRNDIDSVAEEVEQRKSTNDMVFVFGGVGPLHSDISVGGVAKAFGVRLAPDEEFEEYLRHLIGDHCTGDRNELALLPEGITELLHNEILPVPLGIHGKESILVREIELATYTAQITLLQDMKIKCQNVIILSATNVCELDKEWDCLLSLPNTPVVQITSFASTHLSTMLSDVEVAQPVSKLCLEFPDIYIGCHRKSRAGPLVISFVGKDQERVNSAIQHLSQKFHAGAFFGV